MHKRTRVRADSPYDRFVARLRALGCTVCPDCQVYVYPDRHFICRKRGVLAHVASRVTYVDPATVMEVIEA
jgi:hypothetical protein